MDLVDLTLKLIMQKPYFYQQKQIEAKNVKINKGRV